MDNKNLYIQTLIIISLLFFISSCSTPYSPPQISSSDSFLGLEDIIQQSQDKEAVLIVIHGMCDHKKPWITKKVKQFSTVMEMEINFPDSSSIDPLILVSSTSSGIEGYRANLTRETTNENLTIYGIIYSQPSYKKKQSLCSDVSSKTDVCFSDVITYQYERAALNADLKNDLMNNCLADAVYYLGDGGDIIRSGVRQVIDDIFKDIETDEQLKNSSISFISESLGSKVLTDAILCDSASNIANRAHTLAKTQSIFLAANQIPLLNLGDSNSNCAVNNTRTYTNSQINSNQNNWSILAELISYHRQNFPQDLTDIQITSVSPVNIIAFTDPNDLLSYEVTNANVNSKSKITNVTVSNAKTWFGFAEHPLNAHTDYLINSDVTELIRWGND